MARCSTCNTMMVGGYRDGDLQYCSLFCFTQSPVAGFCAQCVAETTDESPGGTFTLNGFGTGWFGASDRCRTCHSVVRGKWIQLLLLPVVRLGRYRMRYAAVNTYIGRKLAGIGARADTAGGPAPFNPGGGIDPK